jgi:hypothetical protein
MAEVGGHSSSDVVPAGRRPEMVLDAWKEGLPMRSVLRKRVIALAQHEGTHNHIKNSRGDTMRIELLPLLPHNQEAPLSEYGVSLAMRLYLHFVAEGAIVFFVMFLLSIATITDSTSRANLRHCCRQAASTPGGYAVVVHGAESHSFNLTPAEADVERSCGAFEQLTQRCGYSGLNIRSFDAAALGSAYANANNMYMLFTALGACEEYANNTQAPQWRDERGHGLLEGELAVADVRCGDVCAVAGRALWQLIVPDLEWRGVPFVVATPNAEYCLRPFESVYWSVWMQFLCICIFLGFLIRLRVLSTRVALAHDNERLTTADYALMFSCAPTPTSRPMAHSNGP